MPLSMLNKNKEAFIERVGGKSDTKRFLESLGFNNGSTVRIISEINGNLIVNIKDARIAISKEMANKIIVKEI